jgi:hypothetical protein
LDRAYVEQVWRNGAEARERSAATRRRAVDMRERSRVLRHAMQTLRNLDRERAARWTERGSSPD